MKAGGTASLTLYNEVNQVFEILIDVNEVGQFLNSPVQLPSDFDVFLYGYRNMMDVTIVKALQLQVLESVLGICDGQGSFLPSGTVLPGGQVLGFDVELRSVEILDGGFVPWYLRNKLNKMFPTRLRFVYASPSNALVEAMPVSPADVTFSPGFGSGVGEKFWSRGVS